MVNIFVIRVVTYFIGMLVFGLNERKNVSCCLRRVNVEVFIALFLLSFCISDSNLNRVIYVCIYICATRVV